MRVVIIMGVAGCGKTTVGKLLGAQLNLPFYDADDFHPEQNIQKMKNGVALDDIDRKPWLEILSKRIEEWIEGKGAVLACSALKEQYRQLLNGTFQKQITWIYLKVGKAEITKRLSVRSEHFFNPVLLNSQFKDLEEPEYGVTINAHQEPKQIVHAIIERVRDDSTI